MKYLLDKFRAEAARHVASDASDQTVTSSEYNQHSADAEFHEEFGLWQEKLITYYSCSYWLSFHRHGWMYITSRYICFHSQWMNEKLLIPFLAVTNISKRGGQSLVSPFTSIVIETQEQEYYFSMFFHPQQVYEYLLQLWKRSMQALLNATTTHESTGDVKSENLDRKTHAASSSESTLTTTGSTPKDSSSESTEEELHSTTLTETFVQKFRLPSSEVLSEGNFCCL